MANIAKMTCFIVFHQFMMDLYGLPPNPTLKLDHCDLPATTAPGYFSSIRFSMCFSRVLRSNPGPFQVGYPSDLVRKTMNNAVAIFHNQSLNRILLMLLDVYCYDPVFVTCY